jgi:hypothetical protein
VRNGMGNGVLVQGSPKVEGTKDQALYYALSRAGKAWSSHILLPLPQTEARGKAQAAVWYVALHIVVAIAARGINAAGVAPACCASLNRMRTCLFVCCQSGD